MSGALFSRAKVWGTTDVITSADLNAEFDNILNNFISTMMQGYSATVGQMQTQVNPGGLGTESLASAVSDEFARIRFVLSEITGQTYWYEAPVTSLSQLNSALGSASFANRINSGVTTGTTGSVQPIFLQPAGSTNKVTLKGSGTTFSYNIAGTAYTISTDVSITGLTVAPSSNNTCIVNDTTMSGQTWTQTAGEYGSTITIATVGTAISNLAGKYAAFRHSTTEYFIGRVASATQIVDCRRGYFFNSSNANVARETFSNGDTLTLMQLTWIYATTSGTLLAGYTNPTYSGTAPASPSIGDYWFDQVNVIWKTYNGTSWIAANATLIGVCIQDGTNTVGARSFDFFESFSPTNTCELIIDQSTAGTVRTRYIGGQTSVYGTAIQQAEGYLNWIAGTNNASGVTVTSGNYYYFYLDRLGNTIIDTVQPYDRRADLQGFYHSKETFRCLGYAYATGSNTFGSVESFFRGDTVQTTTTITTSGSVVPLPDMITLTSQVITVDTTSGAYSLTLPPVLAFKGKSITYMKTSSDYNICTLSVAEPAVLTTTQSCTFAQTTITVASSTGITAGLIVQGNGIARGATVVANTGTTVTLSQPVFTSQSAAAVTFGQAGGIQGNINVTLSTQYEVWTFFSTGTQWIVREHAYPKDWTSFPSLAAGTLWTGVSANPTYGTVVNHTCEWKRDGRDMYVRTSYTQTSGGTNATGAMLFNLFTGPTIDVSVVGNSSASTTVFRATVGTYLAYSNDGAGEINLAPAFVYSSTQLYFAQAFIKNNVSPVVNANYVGVWSAATLAQNVEAILPIVGWCG